MFKMRQGKKPQRHVRAIWIKCFKLSLKVLRYEETMNVVRTLTTVAMVFFHFFCLQICSGPNLIFAVGLLISF